MDDVVSRQKVLATILEWITKDEINRPDAIIVTAWVDLQAIVKKRGLTLLGKSFLLFSFVSNSECIHYQMFCFIVSIAVGICQFNFYRGKIHRIFCFF